MNDVNFIRKIIDLLSNTDQTPQQISPQALSQQGASSDSSNFVGQLKDYIKKLDQPQDNDSNIVDPRDVASPADGDTHFLPPLQLRIEMLKKLTGVEQKHQEQDAQDGSSPELDAQKRQILAHTDGDDPTAS